ncbi:hypothetical protein [Streptomyces sp. SM10]|uniref:hypothetical protein n=1 Tax=Streptomyces sp. SM10 TaxID=565556 RepID=UPI000CD54310|nr:hypothetical protein [Streptomyces sp. SM10]
MKLTFDTSGATPGTVLTATLLVASDSGRAPVVEIPVKIVVPAYQAPLDTGATGSVKDLLGDARAPTGRTRPVRTGCRRSTARRW